MAFTRDTCRGVWVPLVTPFRDGAFDARAQARLVEWLAGCGVHGYLVLGTTGEAAHVGDDEAVQIVRAARAAAGVAPLFAGSGRASTAGTIAMTRRFADAGADGVLVLTPHAYRARMDAAALRRHYHAIADASPVPVFVYHMPEATGLDLAAETLVDCVSHPNVWGFKDSSMAAGPLAATLERTEARGFVGSGPRLLEGLEAGACGGILAVAHLVPEPCVQAYDAWIAGDLAAAGAAQARVARMTEALRDWNVAGIKHGLRLRGLDGGAPRPPLEAPPAEVCARIEAALNAGLETAP